MPTFNLRSTTAVVIKAYEYNGADSPKPLLKDYQYAAGLTTYGEVTQVGSSVTDYSAGDIVVYPSGIGTPTMMNGIEVRIMDETSILYHIS
jgi:NADPH:quinone reductase-like Zn-dependent oxidoreductase